MSKRCIISLANERGNYQKALDRLEASVKQCNPEIDFFGYRSEDEVGAPKHTLNPYSFKVFAFARAYSKGYDEVLWLDSSCYLVGDITPLFDLIRKDGYAMQEAGAFVGDWCNDETLQAMQITRDEAKEMLMYGNAGLLGLKLGSRDKAGHEKATLFFAQWMMMMCGGSFIGDWATHRHDMTCGSIIANMYGMPYNIKGDEILEYAAPETPKKNDTIIIKAQGL